MIRKINNKFLQGQTSLILILVTAAALIFLAVTLNWGRIAQVKSQLSIAADQSATLLASQAASYGEMQKQTWLQNSNYISEWGGYILALIYLIMAIIVTIASYGYGWYSIVIAVGNLALQALVIQPLITQLWNNEQKNQPMVQQFVESGISSALEGSVTDMANVTDYFDWNANGSFGPNASGAPNDTVSRFALFYTERLKMFNQALPPIPQVVYFYNKLGEFVNGETCGESQNDNHVYGTSVDPLCQDAGVKPFPLASGDINCMTNAALPVCQTKVPNSFQLSDSCPVDLNSSDPSYNPYCDPCCVPASRPNPYYNKIPVPAYIPQQPLTIQIRPSYCPANPVCTNNNPYPTYPYVYDPTYQNYADQVSFLAQFGRDQQYGPAFSTSLTPEPQGNPASAQYFPNGVYPFFWEMNYYSPQVDNIDSTNSSNYSPTVSSEPWFHWCMPGTYNGNTVPSVNSTLTTAFPQLAQLNLPYACHAQDCCVNYLADNYGTATSGSTGTIQLTVGSGPIVNVTITGPQGIYNGMTVLQVGSTVNFSFSATETDALFKSAVFYFGPTGAVSAISTYSPPSPAPSVWTDTFSQLLSSSLYFYGAGSLYVTVTDNSNIPGTSNIMPVMMANAPTISFNPSPDNVTSGTTVTFSVTASEAGGTINSVGVSGPPGLTCSGYGGTSNCTWNVAGSGAYTVTATATDSYTLTGSSSITGQIEPAESSSSGGSSGAAGT